jgi:hypothetical protein
MKSHRRDERLVMMSRLIKKGVAMGVSRLASGGGTFLE